MVNSTKSPVTKQIIVEVNLSHHGQLITRSTSHRYHSADGQLITE